MTAHPAGVPATIVVDAANVIGSRPDGWWRDRPGAARRLRDRLIRLAEAPVSVPIGEPHTRCVPAAWVMVVEGAARALAADPPGGASVPTAAPGVATVHVVAAVADGDAEVVRQAAAAIAANLRVVVVTADRGLRSRVHAIGAHPVGPRWLDRVEAAAPRAD